MKQKTVLLKKAEIKKILKNHPLWSSNTKSTQLTRTFKFSSQIDALAFIARVTVHAQVLSHHPEIYFTFGKIKITLTTDSVHGLTKFDEELLKRIDSLK